MGRMRIPLTVRDDFQPRAVKVLRAGDAMIESELTRRLSIVLVQTRNPGNIGSAARAMVNMGLGRLNLVRPVAKWREEAVKMASGALKKMDPIQVHASFDESVAGSAGPGGHHLRAGEAHPSAGLHAAPDRPASEAACPNPGSGASLRSREPGTDRPSSFPGAVTW